MDKNNKNDISNKKNNSISLGNFDYIESFHIEWLRRAHLITKENKGKYFIGVSSDSFAIAKKKFNVQAYEERYKTLSILPYVDVKQTAFSIFPESNFLTKDEIIDNNDVGFYIETKDKIQERNVSVKWEDFIDIKKPKYTVVNIEKDFFSWNSIEQSIYYYVLELDIYEDRLFNYSAKLKNSSPIKDKRTSKSTIGIIGAFDNIENFHLETLKIADEMSNDSQIVIGLFSDEYLKEIFESKKAEYIKDEDNKQFDWEIYSARNGVNSTFYKFREEFIKNIRLKNIKVVEFDNKKVDSFIINEKIQILYLFRNKHKNALNDKLFNTYKDALLKKHKQLEIIVIETERYAWNTLPILEKQYTSDETFLLNSTKKLEGDSNNLLLTQYKKELEERILHNKEHKVDDEKSFKLDKEKAISQVKKLLLDDKNIEVNGGYGVGKSGIVKHAIKDASWYSKKSTSKNNWFSKMLFFFVWLFNFKRISGKPVEIDVMKISNQEFKNGYFFKHFSLKGKIKYIWKNYLPTIAKFAIPISLGYYVIPLTVISINTEGNSYWSLSHFTNFQFVETWFLWFAPIILALMTFILIGLVMLMNIRKKVIVVTEINFLGNDGIEQLNSLIWSLHNHYKNDIFIFESSNSIDANTINKWKCSVIDVDYGDKSNSYGIPISSLLNRLDAIQLKKLNLTDGQAELMHYIIHIYKNNSLIINNFSENIRYIYQQLSWREIDNINEEFIRYYDELEGEINYMHFLCIRYLQLYEKDFFNHFRISLTEQIFKENSNIFMDETDAPTFDYDSIIKSFNASHDKHFSKVQSEKIFRDSHLLTEIEIKMVNTSMKELHSIVETMRSEKTTFNSEMDYSFELLNNNFFELRKLNAKFEEELNKYIKLSKIYSDANRIMFSFNDERYMNNYLRLSHWDYLDYALIKLFVTSPIEFMRETMRKKIDVRKLDLSSISNDVKISFVHELIKDEEKTVKFLFENDKHVSNEYTNLEILGLLFKDDNVDYHFPLFVIIEKIMKSVNDKITFFETLQSLNIDKHEKIKLKIVFAKWYAHHIEFMQSIIQSPTASLVETKVNSGINTTQLKEWILDGSSSSSIDINDFPKIFFSSNIINFNNETITLVDKNELYESIIKWKSISFIYLVRFTPYSPFSKANLLLVVDKDLKENIQKNLLQIANDSGAEYDIFLLSSKNQRDYECVLHKNVWDKITPVGSKQLWNRIT